MGSRLDRKSEQVRKRIENHAFTSETGDEYEASTFGGFGDYMRRKKLKLQNLDAETRANSSQPQIFKGIVCHVNGYTQPSLNDLHKMIVAHGGGFLQYLDGKTMCTHIIASNLTPKKKEEFRRYRIVKPAWIVDSVREGRLLPWDGYRVVDEGAGQKILGFENGAMTSQVNNKSAGYRDQTDTSWYTEQLKAHRSSFGASIKPATQPTPPEEDIEDDENLIPEITASMEEALNSTINLSGAAGPEATEPKQLLDVQTELETPPPSSPVLTHEELDDEMRPPDAGSEVANQHFQPSKDAQPSIKMDAPHGAEKEQDATEDFSVDFVSHAVVRDSEIMQAVSPSKLAKMTAEEHNALLLSDPKIRKSTVVHPDFLEQYYRESRLHHLSTWKADLKSQLQALAAEKSSSQQARDARSKAKKLPGQRRYIMHVDFDSFFAAVSLKKHPQYVDKPCVIAHGGGSGSEIASCNYPARKFGISNGMWMKRAQELCPDLKILPYDFPAYEDASRKFYSAIMATDGIVQSVSIDEALVDISATCIAFAGSDGVRRAEGAVNREQSKADEIGQQVRSEVLRETGCNVSVGIGGNILQAKVALRKAKPAGQYQIKPEDVLDFIGALEVKSLPGVAWSIGGKLEEIGITFVKDIRDISKEKLINTLGPKTGEKIWEYARGIDRTEVGDQVIRKSVSAEVNWGVRFATQEQVDEFMHGLCGELHNRLLKERVKGRQLTMKVMRRALDAPRDPPKHLGHGKCDTFNKSMQLGVATNETGLIAKEAIAMLKSFNISPGELRGIGVQMQKLDPIKSGAEGLSGESSQRRLQFKSAAAGATIKQASENPKVAEDPIQDDARAPETKRFTDAKQPSKTLNPVTAGTPTKKPLNTLGTQFILPTQVDPSVLAELPEDIRAKLARHGAPQDEDQNDVPHAREVDSKSSSRAQSPAIDLPAQSQLDPSILDALPADVREEILGFYGSPRKDKAAQALLPQSPRKVRALPPTKQNLKRKRGGGLLSSRFKPGASSTDHPTLTQSNFVSRPPSRNLPDTDGGTTTDTEPEEVDQDFLAALPEDIRAEVLDQQRQARLSRTAGIDLSLHQRANKKKRLASADGPLDRLLHLEPRPAKPTFTSRKLSELPDLREAVSAWHEEFHDEGPYEEDIFALSDYLRAVVTDECDMAKVVGVVRWLSWVLEEDVKCSEDVRRAWEAALTKVKEDVQGAVMGRGLSYLSFD